MRWSTKRGAKLRQVATPCHTCGEDIVDQISNNRKYCNISCRNSCPAYRAMLRSAGQKAATRDTTGSKNPNWRGGTTKARHKLMSTKAYKAWRKRVYERDNYTCVLCLTPGNGKNLNADHIKPYATHADLALDITNGRTLCVDCHKQTDTYGWKMFNTLRKMETKCQQ